MSFLRPIQTLKIGPLEKIQWESPDLELWVEINESSVVYVLANANKSKVFFLGEYQATEPSTFNHPALLQPIFEQDIVFVKMKGRVIHLSHSLSPFSILPTEINLIQDPEKEWQACNTLAESTLQVAFHTPNQVMAAVQSYLHPRTISHRVEGLFKWMFSHLKQSEQGVFLDISGRTFFILLFRDKQLLFANQFQFKAPEDIVYFLQLAYQQHPGFDAEKDVLHVSSNIRQDSLVYTTLLKFFRHVELYGQGWSHKGIEQCSAQSYLSLQGTLS
ncbi:MAG: hypothetical protein RL138_919 [Bacteroidota bacterium]|jgi:hypothetical protein